MKKLKRIINKIINFINGTIESIKNLIKWFPVIYKDRQFDHAFLLYILEFKLNLMEYYFKNHGIALSSIKDSKRIKICKNLCRRLGDGYHDNVFIKHYEKWGLPEFDGDMGLTHKNCKTEEDCKQERFEFKKAIEKEEYLRKQDLKYLFKTMEKYILGWWD